MDAPENIIVFCAVSGARNSLQMHRKQLYFPKLVFEMVTTVPYLWKKNINSS
jgi:hypothetical protein